MLDVTLREGACRSVPATGAARRAAGPRRLPAPQRQRACPATHGIRARGHPGPPPPTTAARRRQPPGRRFLPRHASAPAPPRPAPHDHTGLLKIPALRRAGRRCRSQPLSRWPTRPCQAGRGPLHARAGARWPRAGSRSPRGRPQRHRQSAQSAPPRRCCRSSPARPRAALWPRRRRARRTVRARPAAPCQPACAAATRARRCARAPPAAPGAGAPEPFGRKLSASGNAEEAENATGQASARPRRDIPAQFLDALAPSKQVRAHLRHPHCTIQHQSLGGRPWQPPPVRVGCRVANAPSAPPRTCQAAAGGHSAAAGGCSACAAAAASSERASTRRPHSASAASGDSP